MSERPAEFYFFRLPWGFHPPCSFWLRLCHHCLTSLGTRLHWCTLTCWSVLVGKFWDEVTAGLSYWRDIHQPSWAGLRVGEWALTVTLGGKSDWDLRQMSLIDATQESVRYTSLHRKVLPFLKNQNFNELFQEVSTLLYYKMEEEIGRQTRP